MEDIKYFIFHFQNKSSQINVNTYLSTVNYCKEILPLIKFV